MLPLIGWAARTRLLERRRGLVWTGAWAISGWLALTWRALRGQSLIAPGRAGAIAAGLMTVVVVASLATLRTPRRAPLLDIARHDEPLDQAQPVTRVVWLMEREYPSIEVPPPTVTWRISATRIGEATTAVRWSATVAFMSSSIVRRAGFALLHN